MVGARAATSLSFTIGIAFATLVVTAGILGGPAILDCSHQPGSIGACLRGKVIQVGLLSEPEEPTPVASTELSLPSAIADTSRPADTGWLDANANEYSPPPSGAASLSGEAGRVDAAGIATAPADATALVALAEPQGSLDARGTASAIDIGPAAVVLTEPAGRLDTGSTPTIEANIGEAALAAPAGSIEVIGGEGSGTAASAIATTRPAPVGQQLLTGRIGNGASVSGAAVLAAILTADLSQAPLFETVAAPLAGPDAPASPSIKYDPHYPNVIVLPPPARGENSSFARLEVR